MMKSYDNKSNLLCILYQPKTSFEKIILYHSLLPAGVFELVSYQVKSGLVSQFEHRLLQDYPQLNYNPLGLWYSVFGDINRGTYIHADSKYRTVNR